MTRGPSGSFEARFVTAAGGGRFVSRATSPSGEVCSAAASTPRRRVRSRGGRGTIARDRRRRHRRDRRRGVRRGAGAPSRPRRLEAFLDGHGLGAGPVRAVRIGDGGGSNFSFLLERGDERFVLRRPPRPPLPPSAHDMVREARLQLALAPQGIRLPPILAVCEDEGVLGVPFYVMRFLDGHVVTTALPAGLEEPAAGAGSARSWSTRSSEIHAADVAAPALAAFARPGSYLERQVRRFSQLWEINATREIPASSRWRRRLADELPEPLPDTVVHGDYRLGNLMVEREPARPRRRPCSTGRWERSATRAPTSATCSRRTPSPAAAPSPLGVSPVTALDGLPDEGGARCALRRAERTRRRAARLVRGARALEGRGLLRGDLRPLHARASSAPRTRAPPRFEQAVPLMAETARRLAAARAEALDVCRSRRDRAPRPVTSVRPGFAREDWNARYAQKELVWTAEPNRLFAAEVGGLAPGRALDLACGEGRNAVWLAERGWQVTGVDFSDVALAKAAELAASRGVEVEWVVADVLDYEPEPRAFDLVAVLYLQLPREELCGRCVGRRRGGARRHLLVARPRHDEPHRRLRRAEGRRRCSTRPRTSSRRSATSSSSARRRSSGRCRSSRARPSRSTRSSARAPA